MFQRQLSALVILLVLPLSCFADLCELYPDEQEVIRSCRYRVQQHFPESEWPLLFQRCRNLYNTYLEECSGQDLTGSYHQYSLLTMNFRGPESNELADSPSPFLDHRMIVHITAPSGRTYDVHVFFNGDGNGGDTGNIWTARFIPEEQGGHSYTVTHRTGNAVAVSVQNTPGTPGIIDGLSGTFTVRPPVDSPQGFEGKGVLQIGNRYLRFSNGEYFLKAGTNSPENFLGYKGFDGTVDSTVYIPGNHCSAASNFLHTYSPHAHLFREGDPYFESNINTTEGVPSNSKGIIGALRYLENVGINSVYFLPLNYGGDGCDTAPFISDEANSFARTHYDLSKLHQWDQVLQFAQQRGILLHFVLRETETGNEELLGPINQLTVQRKLFYREMVARFGSYYATKWNLSEESDLSDEAVLENKAYLRYLLPYQSPIAIHTHGVQSEYDENLEQTKLLYSSDPTFGETSIQYHNHDQASDIIEELALILPDTSISMDENGTPGEGVTPNNVDDMRKRVLYDVLFSGGQIEWYAGYHELPLGGDMRLEDFSTREELWEQTAHARRFMESYLPFWEMEPADELLTGESNQYGGGEVFTKRGEIYALYLPNESQEAVLDLRDGRGAFLFGYYNPRTGLFDGESSTLHGGSFTTLPEPPDASQDWVVLLVKQ